MRQITLAIIFVALAGLPAVAADQATPAPANGGYIGSTACRTCHPFVWNQFYKNPHYKSLASSKEAPENTGCESCHGPGANHIKNRGGKQTIVAFSLLAAEKTNDACLRCHSQTLSRANIRRSQHTVNGMACTSCHSIHKAETTNALLQKPEATLCYECHTDVRAQFNMPFRHRVNEGIMTCSDCHNPHGTSTPTWGDGAHSHMVNTSKNNEDPCVNCHADKRGPFIFEHAVIRVDGCQACHSPHGSTNSRLLKRPVVFTLCLECHNGAGSFGRQANGVVTQTANHNMADPRYQNCTACHTRIHGSNADSNFLR